MLVLAFGSASIYRADGEASDGPVGLSYCFDGDDDGRRTVYHLQCPLRVDDRERKQSTFLPKAISASKSFFVFRRL